MTDLKRQKSDCTRGNVGRNGHGTTCEICGDYNAIYGLDPVAWEIHGDDSPRWLCEACREQRRWDI
jgi:hypothetical protein